MTNKECRSVFTFCCLPGRKSGARYAFSKPNIVKYEKITLAPTYLSWPRAPDAPLTTALDTLINIQNIRKIVFVSKSQAMILYHKLKHENNMHVTVQKQKYLCILS